MKSIKVWPARFAGAVVTVLVASALSLVALPALPFGGTAPREQPRDVRELWQDRPKPKLKTKHPQLKARPLTKRKVKRGKKGRQY